jgi:diguanylate cyclase (GGDEF)-like protein
LGGERSPADVRKLVEGLIAATRAMEHRAKSLEGELQASSQQVSELRDKLADVRKESLTDPLTCIANRKAFDEAARSALAAVTDEEEEVALLLCDIDHFKNFNDTWGHQTGDQVLRLVAACLSENVKGRDTAARYGGEEFAVLLRGTSLEAATRVANQIRTTVEHKKLVKKSTGDVLGTITISIGVAQIGRGEAIETWCAVPMPVSTAPSTMAATWWSTSAIRAWPRSRRAQPSAFFIPLRPSHRKRCYGHLPHRRFAYGGGHGCPGNQRRLTNSPHLQYALASFCGGSRADIRRCRPDGRTARSRLSP